MAKAKKYKNVIQGAKNRKKGASAETEFIGMLKRIGDFVLIERIETGRRFDGSYVAPVSGDIHAIERVTGRAVLCEVKSPAHKLLYSTLKTHQHAALQVAHDAGAIALVGWKSEDGLVLLRYPIDGFVPRSSLTYEQAVNSMSTYAVKRNEL